MKRRCLRRISGLLATEALILSAPLTTAAPAQQPAEASAPDKAVPAAAAEPSAIATESEMAAAEPPESDAEDEKDLARLDGEQPGGAIADSKAGEAKAPKVSRSLLDYADPEPGSVTGESTEATSSNSEPAPASEPGETGAQAIVEAAEPQPAVAEAPADAVRRLPFTTWMRLQRIIEGSQTACVLVGGEPMARSSAGLTLRLGAGTRDQGMSGMRDQGFGRISVVPGGTSFFLKSATPSRPPRRQKMAPTTT